MKKKKISICCLLVLIICACLVFWKGFMRGSDVAWTVQQNGYWDAVLEMALIFWINFIIFTRDFSKKAYKYILLSAVFLVFSFLHAFFYAAIICAAYAIMIYLTGYLISKALFDKKKSNEFHYYFVTGMASIIIIIAVLSLFKIGTPEKLRVIFPLIFALEVIVLHRDIRYTLMKSYKRMQENQDTDQNLIISVEIAIVLTMLTFAVSRANLGLDYDSLWYGLRSDFVLAPKTGIFDKVVLMACVYTYSKGIEVLALPFAGLSSYSFIIGVNIVFCVVTLLAIYDLGRKTLPKVYSIAMVVLVVLTPSIMNMATIYLQVVVLLYAISGIREKDPQYLAMAFSALALSFGFKPSSIVFSTLIVIVIVLFMFFQKLRISIKSIRFLIVSIFAVALLWFRTWMITGYPITSLLVSFFEKIGYYPKYPYTLPSANTMSVKELFTTGAIWERFARLFRIFFMPDAGDIYTLEISWWGVLFTVLWIVSMVMIFLRPIKTMKRMKENTIYAFQVISLVICSVASVGCMLILSTPDGNYFMLMHVLTYWFVVTELADKETTLQNTIQFLMIPLVSCNFLLSIAISWSWQVGVTPIDLRNVGYYNHKELYVRPTLAENSMTEINEYLTEQYKNGTVRRLIGFTRKEHAMYLLSAIVEGCVQQEAWGAETLSSESELSKFMECAKVDGLLLEKEYISSQKGYLNIITQLAQDGIVKTEYESENYLILSVGANQKDDNTIQYFTELLNE